MKVAYVCADAGVPVFGTKGSSIHVQEILAAIMRRAFDVELFAATTGGAMPPQLASLTLHTLKSVARGDHAQRERELIAQNAELQTLCRERAPFSLVYERYSLWSRAAIDFAAASAIPSVLEVNAPLIEEQAHHRVLIDVACATATAAGVFRKATTVAAVSEEVASHVRKVSGRREGIIVVPNGVSAERFANAEKEPHDGFTIAFLGTLKPWHGLPLLVDAFAAFHERHRDSRLLIIGDGPGRQSLLDHLEARGIADAATLTGSVPPGEVPRLLARADVALAPYPEEGDFYFSPLKIVESMAAGLPVIATRVGQIPQLIRDGVDGLLCGSNVDDVAAALERLFANDDLRKRIGDAARARALTHYTWDGVLDRILAATLVAPEGARGR